MKEEVSESEKAVEEIVLKSLELMDKTGDFIITEAPLILQEFYNWHMMEHILFMIICLVVVLSLIKYSIRSIKEIFLNMNDSIKHFFGATLMPIVIIPGIVIFFREAYYLVFMLVAPKLYLIEYFMK